MEWINVKHHLPNDDEISYDGIGYKGRRRASDMVLATDSENHMEVGYFVNSAQDHKGTTKRWEFFVVVCRYPNYKHDIYSASYWEPIAWMPLPKPYKPL